MKSLRTRLIAWLMPPILVVGLVASAGAYLFMKSRLTAVYDQDLADIAGALVPYIGKQGGGVGLSFSEQADAVLRADSTDRIFYAVLDGNGRMLAGDPDIAASPPEFEGRGPVFWDAVLSNRPLRLAALRTTIQDTPVIVLAAETTLKRDRAARDALFSAMALVALLAIALLAAIVMGVRRGLVPVDRLRAEVQARSHLDLRPIGETRVVEELEPLVDELNGMLARLREAQLTQTRFIANAAHQLRTPIAGLLTQLELARTDPEGSEGHITGAREAAARLARLAQQILSLAAADPVSNPDAGLAHEDLANIVEGQAASWLRAATPRDVEMEFDLASAPVYGNALLVGELASNLVDNALRYGGRTVKISTRRWGDKSLLEVTDDGPGIPRTERERIFERFHRVNGTNAEGSGLGLAIVHEIAQRHGATIEVTEGPERIGTRVGVLFPGEPRASL